MVVLVRMEFGNLARPDGLGLHTKAEAAAALRASLHSPLKDRRTGDDGFSNRPTIRRNS